MPAADGGLDESSGDSELCQAESVLDGLRASPVVYAEEEVGQAGEQGREEVLDIMRG